jgi:hypothetical protein
MVVRDGPTANTRCIEAGRKCVTMGPAKVWLRARVPTRELRYSSFAHLGAAGVAGALVALLPSIPPIERRPPSPWV